MIGSPFAVRKSQEVAQRIRVRAAPCEPARQTSTTRRATSASDAARGERANELLADSGQRADHQCAARRFRLALDVPPPSIGRGASAFSPALSGRRIEPASSNPINDPRQSSWDRDAARVVGAGDGHHERPRPRSRGRSNIGREKPSGGPRWTPKTSNAVAGPCPTRDRLHMCLRDIIVMKTGSYVRVSLPAALLLIYPTRRRIRVRGKQAMELPAQPRTIDVRILRVLIAAGAGGIGRAIAEGFVSGGAQVHITDISQAAIDDAVTQIAGLMGTLGDASDPHVVGRVVAEVRARFEGLDVLVNNVGVAGPTGGVDTYDEEDVNRTIDVKSQVAVLLLEALRSHASEVVEQPLDHRNELGGGAARLRAADRTPRRSGRSSGLCSRSPSSSGPMAFVQTQFCRESTKATASTG
jgi:hypothetical protein